MYKIDNITKTYGKNLVLDKVSLDIDKGECVGLLGINGSGKSTLLSIIAGGLKANSGRAYFEDEEGIVGFLPQDNPLIEELTAKDNIKLWFDGDSKDIFSEENKALFHELGVDAFINKPVKAMSGGMKKRLSLAITMMAKPDLLLLDEPLAALDLLCKNGILTYLKGYLKKGGRIIIATHDSTALNICTSVYSIKNGHIEKEIADEVSHPDSDYINILMS